MKLDEARYKELLGEINAPRRMARWRDAPRPKPGFGLRLAGALLVGTAAVIATGGVSVALVTHRGPFAPPAATATAMTSSPSATAVSTSTPVIPSAIATAASPPRVSSPPGVTAPATAAPTPSSQPVTPPTAPTVTLLDDSYTASDYRNANYGTEAQLVVDNQSPFRKTYLKFSVQGLTGTPRSVQLRLYSTSAGTGFQVHPVPAAGNSWSETSITANNAPPFSAAVGYHPPFKANAWQTYDVTSIVTGNGTFSLVITGNTLATFASKEAGPFAAPQLVIS